MYTHVLSAQLVWDWVSLLAEGGFEILILQSPSPMLRLLVCTSEAQFI